MAKWVRVLGISTAVWWGACSLVNVPEEPVPAKDTGTGASDSTGSAGGSSGCTEAADCGTDTDCLTFACNDGTCSEEAQPEGTACNSDGSICDAMAKCVPATCMDGFKDGDESDIDCGGACSPCENGKDCNEAVDCQSGYCPPVNGQEAGMCSSCTEHAQCPSDQWCTSSSSSSSNSSGGSGGTSSADGGSGGASTVGGSCVADQAQGASCASDDECEGNVNCVDGTCCDAASCGTCESCATGSCLSVTNKDDPGTCEGTSACNSAGECVLHHGQNCTLGSDCLSTNCVDNTCCEVSSCSTCEACNIGDSGTCQTLTNQDDLNGNCTVTLTCDASGNCRKKNGQSCSSGSECASSQCVDGRCCNSKCLATCKACNLTGSLGTCSVVTTNEDDDTCSSTVSMNCAGGSCTCDAAGVCKSALGEQEANPNNCASGASTDGVCCKTSICDTCEACNVSGSEGACASISGDDDSCNSSNTTQCNGNDCTCDAGGMCKSDLGQVESDPANCASGNSTDGYCCSTDTCGTCQACDNLNGICADIASGADPDSCPTATHECAAGECKRKDGQDCSDNSACASGNCVDNTCCDAASCGTCETCNNSSGVCQFVSSGGTDTDSCSGTCNGTGTCITLLPDGSVCSSASECSIGYCVRDTCQLPQSCGDHKLLNSFATNGIYTIDPDGPGSNNAPYQVECDMSLGGYTMVNSLGFAAHNKSYLGYRLLDLAAMHNDSVQSAFIESYNKQDGLWNLDSGFTSGHCCISFSTTESLAFGTSSNVIRPGEADPMPLASNSQCPQAATGFIDARYTINRALNPQLSDLPDLATGYFGLSANLPMAGTTCIAPVGSSNNYPGYFLGNTVVLHEAAKGSWQSDGQRGIGQAQAEITLTGRVHASVLANAYYTFDLKGYSGMNFARAELHLYVEKYHSAAAFEQLSVWDVSHTAKQLEMNGTTNVAIYTDLMSGTNYASSLKVLESSGGLIFVMPLNASAVSDIETTASNADTLFSVGIQSTTAGATAPDFIQFTSDSSTNNTVNNTANNTVNNTVNNTINDSTNNTINNTINNSTNNTINNTVINPNTNYALVLYPQ